MYNTKPFKEDSMKIELKRSKPRAKALNEALMTRKPGRMNEKDVGRNKDKQALRRALDTYHNDTDD